MPFGTIGIATYNDPDGLWATIQSLRIHHANELKDWEVLVVDNDPYGRGARRSEKLVRSLNKQNGGAQYQPLSHDVGVYTSKNKIFEHARGEVVMCLDSHVLLWPSVLAKLKRWFTERPESKDIVSGPMILDSMLDWSTHLTPIWRGESFGTWGKAWRAPTGEVFAPVQLPTGLICAKLDVANTPSDFQVKFSAKTNPNEVLRAAGCLRLAPSGYLGADNYDEIEIAAMGIGAFACRKDAWPGYHPSLRGHGGGEITIHEKFRRQGGRALSLSWFKWHHNFNDSRKVEYPITRRNRVRNWAITFQELGWSLDPIRDHYVGNKLITQEQWDVIEYNPIGAPFDAGPDRRPPKAPTDGPGREFKLLTEAIGIKSKPGCSCNALMRQMNTWGVEGCLDPENRGRALQQIQENLEKWSWSELLMPGLKALWSGKPLTIPAMYDEAVRRAEAKLAAVAPPA